MVKVGEQQIAMNPFVDSLFINVIMGLIDSLDKIPEDKSRIEIVITRN